MALVLKTSDPARDRGFESLSLRHTSKRKRSKREAKGTEPFASGTGGSNPSLSGIQGKGREAKGSVPFASLLLHVSLLSQSDDYAILDWRGEVAE